MRGRLRNTAIAGWVMLSTALLVAPGWAATAGAAQSPQDALAAAIAAVRGAQRPGYDQLATVRDGAALIQCRASADQGALLDCEAASGETTPDRINRLERRGWLPVSIDGGYTRIFGPRAPDQEVAGQIMAALAEGYAADPTRLKVATSAAPSPPCPARAGPDQTVAGACAYTPPLHEPPVLGPGATTDDIVETYAHEVRTEIARLRASRGRRAFAVFDAKAGYIQCETRPSADGLYCEAQSAESWRALAPVLTPERVALLHAAGYADPGPAPNYSKTYPPGSDDDMATAREILTLLHQVYGYDGLDPIAITTEAGH